MGKYNWKENYGFDETVSSVVWLSVVGDKNIATNATLRNRPKYSLGAITGLSNVHYVLSSGRHTGSFIVNTETDQYYHGQGMKDTIFEKSISAGRLYYNFYDMKIVSNIGNGTSYYIPFYRCDIVGVIANNASFFNCKIRTLPTGGTSFGANSFIGVTIPINKFTSNNLLYDNCNISITSQSDEPLCSF